MRTRASNSTSPAFTLTVRGVDPSFSAVIAFGVGVVVALVLGLGSRRTAR